MRYVVINHGVLTRPHANTDCLLVSYCSLLLHLFTGHESLRSDRMYQLIGVRGH